MSPFTFFYISLPHNSDKSFDIGILFKTVKRLNSYDSGDTMTPHSPRKKDCKLYNLLIVYQLNLPVGNRGMFDPGCLHES